jgi:hypothetical protein
MAIRVALLWFALNALLLVVSPSLSEPAGPKISGEISVEIENDHTYRADDSDQEINDLSTTIESEFAIHLNPILSLQSEVTIETVGEGQQGKDQTFEDMGLFVESLTLNYDGPDFGFFIGKHTVNFGLAWDVAPGIYGADLAEDYELTERLGLGGYVTFGDEELGEHRLSLSSFFIDTSVLSQSAFNNRGRVRLSDGGVGNTEDFSSFAIALDGRDIPALPGLRYHLGWLHQAAGQGDEEDERGAVVGAYYVFEPDNDLTLTPLVEFAHLDNFEGSRGIDAYYLTAALGIEYQNWHLDFVYGYRDVDENQDYDHGFQLSAGYDFDIGLSIEAGWLGLNVEDEKAESLGLLITYTYEFGD